MPNEDMPNDIYRSHFAGNSRPEPDLYNASFHERKGPGTGAFEGKYDRGKPRIGRVHLVKLGVGVGGLGAFEGTPVG